MNILSAEPSLFFQYFLPERRTLQEIVGNIFMEVGAILQEEYYSDQPDVVSEEGFQLLQWFENIINGTENNFTSEDIDDVGESLRLFGVMMLGNRLQASSASNINVLPTNYSFKDSLGDETNYGFVSQKIKSLGMEYAKQYVNDLASRIHRIYFRSKHFDEDMEDYDTLKKIKTAVKVLGKVVGRR